MENQRNIFEKSGDFFCSRWWAAVLLIGLVFFALGFWSGGYEEKASHREEEKGSVQIRQSDGYNFINPLLECENFSEGNFLRSKPLEEELLGILQEAEDNQKIKHLSVYFRDLNQGAWLGFNEDEKFTPASLLKVPLLMAYLKKAESEPELLKKELVYKRAYGDNKTDPNIRPEKQLIEGKSYQVEEVLETMIRYSDNNSVNLLLRSLDNDFIFKVYSDLSVPFPKGESPESEDFMSVKEYASFFRILYNASYLNREMSEKALRILSSSAFEKGIVAGIPEGIVVAHKFGERRFEDMVQLHDCGIIYNPSKPYLLCVMTRGDDFGELEEIIQRVSQTVWQEIKKE